MVFLTSGLDINLNTSELFQWTQMITDSMMPVIYIVCGISLGFIIIRALKGAFSN